MKSEKGVSIKGLTTLLIFLISGFVITGISFLDGKVWEVIFGIAGSIAYAIVGILIDVGLNLSKRDRSDLFWVILLILVVFIYKIYCALVVFKLWLMSIPLWIKILVVSAFGLASIFVGILKICKSKKKKENCDENKQLY